MKPNNEQKNKKKYIPPTVVSLSDHVAFLDCIFGQSFEGCSTGALFGPALCSIGSGV